jgi:hypothetical protein
MKKITETQKELLKKIQLYKYIKNNTGIFGYDEMKQICNFKTFDATFNALLNKGYLKHFATNDFNNKFILTKN